MDDLTEKYVGKDWYLDGEKLNPNFAMLLHEFDNYDYFILQGGTRSGKTYSTIQYFWRLVTMFSDIEIGIVRQSMPTLKGSVLLDFLKIGKDAELYKVNNHNKTDNIYKHDSNVITFLGADDDTKLQGRKFDILYLNEGPELAWDSVNQLMLRLNHKLIIDYNPNMPDSWVYDKIMTMPKVAFLKTTYRDNPFISQRILDNLEWMRVNSPDEYLVFGLGEKGEVQGQVYTHWKRIKEEAFPDDANVFVVDFGFSPDPTCIIRGCIKERVVYAKELIYQNGLTSPDILIHLYFHGYDDDKGHVLIADSASPAIISELRDGVKITDEEIYTRCANLGYNPGPMIMARLKKFIHEGGRPLGMKKPPGSILGGINMVKAREVLITEDSKNAWMEQTKYKNKKNKFTGEFTKEPVDKDNHFADCLRYMVMAEGRFFNL